MPQFKPDYVNIPKEIKENPEKFGLQQDYWPPKKPSLSEVESCNEIARTPRMDCMLTEEQWESYWKAVMIIKRFEHELAFNRLFIKEGKKARKLREGSWK